VKGDEKVLTGKRNTYAGADPMRKMADILLVSEAVFLLLWLVGVPMMDFAALTLLLLCIPAASVRLVQMAMLGVAVLVRRLRPLRPGDLRLGMTVSWPHVPIVLPSYEREGHVAILGRTGSGKSTMMETLVTQDLQAGRKVILVDPHTRLAREMAHTCLVIGRMPVLVVPGVAGMHSVNLLETGPHWTPVDAARCVTDGLVQVFMPYQDELPMRIRHLVECAAYFLAAADDGYTLLEIPRFLRSRAFRDHLADKVLGRNGGGKDLASLIPGFSLGWLEDLTRTQLHEQVQSTWTRILTLLSPPDAQRLIGCSRSTFTFEQIQEGTPLLIGIGQARLHRSAHLLNALLTTWLTKRLLAGGASWGTGDPINLYVDELAEISPESFQQLLHRARKEAVRLTVIVQAQTMLDRSLYQALLGNVSTLLIFGSSGPGVEELAREISRPLPAEPRDGAGQYLMELQRQLHQTASDLRDLRPHEFILHRAASPCPALPCRTNLPPRVDDRAVARAVDLALSTRGRSPQGMEAEIQVRQMQLDQRFGSMRGLGPGPGILGTAPW
jgi:energy-coupling factor transporter ATP-binding protein EcfA2